MFTAATLEEAREAAIKEFGAAEAEIKFSIIEEPKKGLFGKLKGKGVPSLRDKNVRGDHYVTLVVQVPTKLNSEQRELLRKFDEAMGGNSAPEEGKKKKFFK